MKTKIITSAIILSSLAFFGCSQNNENYAGCWLGESNMIFEVLPDGESTSQFIIRNINGDLKAAYSDGAIRGKNELDMDYEMKVKGDSAYYTFGSYTTGYKRIDKAEYEKLFAEQQKATLVE